MKYLFPFLVLFAFALSDAAAQVNERNQAIKYYLDGNDIEAILALEQVVKQRQFASDAEVINYLGLAYQNALDDKKARKMFEKAVKLQPGNSVYRANLAYVYLLARQLNKSQQQAEKALQLDPSNVSAYFVIGTADLWEGKPDEAMATAEKMMNIDPGFLPGYMLKSDVLISTLGGRVAAGSTVRTEIDFLRQSVAVLEAGLKNIKPNTNRKAIDDKLEGLKVFYEHYSRDRSLASTTTPPTPEPGVTPVKIISKRPASYTDSARSAGVQGSVRLAVLLGANGTVVQILKLKGLGYGLDEQAIRAARQIVFQPKMKDGVPVSTVVTIDYSFSIY
ncbi:MAG: TonB family protein [Pyrinomonadaceae bacterium]